MAAWVPLLQTLAWAALIIAGAKRFDVQIQTLVDAIQRRIISGSSVKAGPFELGEDVKALERVEQAHSRLRKTTGAKSVTASTKPIMAYSSHT